MTYAIGTSPRPRARRTAARVAAAALALLATSASAADNGPTQTGSICMQKVFGTPVTQSNKVNCTANDIRLSGVSSVSPTSCFAGTTFALTATFDVDVTANARYDAGFFFRIDGGTNARGDGSTAAGTCSLSALTPGLPPALGLDGDTCGDLNAGKTQVTFTIPDVACEDTDGDGLLNLPYCTSWHSNQGTGCAIAKAGDFRPDTKSKCVCDDTFQVPVTVDDPSLTVVKTATPTSVVEPGDLVVFEVDIENGGNSLDLTIDTIVDSVFGDLLDPGNALISDNTCDDLLDEVLAPGAAVSCTFAAEVAGVSGDPPHHDVVEVCATQTTTSKSVCGDDDATVTFTDTTTSPTVVKSGTVKSTSCTIEVTYQVEVSNPSALDPLTVTALTDDEFGSLLSTHDDVLSTTCVGGSVIAAGTSYTCSFVGRITRSPCGGSHTDIVTATTTDDGAVRTATSNAVTVTPSLSVPVSP